MPELAAIEAVGLTKSYGRDRGIVAVDLRVQVGEVMGLVGANGAGKTTLMRTLLDFVRPTAGTLRILGHDSVRESVSVRRRCTYLPGDLVLPPRLTGHGVLARFAFARPEVPASRYTELAERLDLDLDRKVGDLSKGNKQKIGLVLAFAPRPEVLVLDEPTSGLDPVLQREFADMVAEVSQDGRTVLLSSHVMTEVEQVTGRVALMFEGRVTAVDDMRALRVQARRRGRAETTTTAALAPLTQLLARTPGVSEVQVSGDAVSFALDGPADALVKALATVDIATLELTHADLEDAFFTLYDGDAGEGQP